MLRFLPRVRCIFCALSVLAVLGTPAGAIRQEHNAITPAAPGWLFAASGPGVPDEQSPEGFLVGKDTTLTHTGKASATIQATSTAHGLFRALTQGLRADAYRGKRLRLCGYAKTTGVTDLAALWMRVDGDQRTLAFDNMASHPLQGTTDWQRYAVVLDVPQEAEDIYFGAGLVGPGQVWVDDLSLQIVDPQQVAATAPPSAPWPAQPVNLDFETPPTPSTSTAVVGDAVAIAGWDYSKGPVALDRGLAHGGKASVTLKALDAAADDDRSLEQIITADAYWGKRVRLSGYLKTSGVMGWAALWMRVDGPARKRLSFDNMNWGKKDRSVKGTTDWQAYSIVLDVPQEARAIYFGALLIGPGQVWADDLSLQVVDPKTVASTDVGNLIPAHDVAAYKKVMAERKQAAAARKKLPLHPMNLGFEQ